MAARLNPRNSELARQKIQTTQLLKRLSDDAFGLIELTDGQRDSAKFLINKSLGNPPQTVAIDPDANEVKVSVSFVDPPKPNRDKPGH